MSTGEQDTSEVLGVLQAKGDHFAKLSVIEKKRLMDLEDAIEHITTETEKYREKAKRSAIDVMNLHILTPNPAYQRADGVSVGKDAAQVTSKVLRVLEVKLDKLLQTRSEVDIKNQALRDDIDHMRRLRMQTDNSHHRFEADMRVSKQKIETILGSATEIVEQRERLLELKETLERQNVEEQKKFEEEYEEMGKYIKEQNLALEDALLKDRKEGDKPDTKDNSKGGAVGVLSSEDEDEMAGRVGVLANFVQNEQDSLQTIQKTISHYETMFDNLRQMTGTESLKDVISTYQHIEEEMFSLYNYCQALNSEIEVVLESQTQIHREVDTYKNQQEEQDEVRQKALGALQSKLRATEDQIVESENQSRKYSDCVEQISKKVQSLFFKLQCDQMEAKQQPTKGAKGTTMSRPESKVALLTGQGGVSDSNVLDYMAIIEQRAVDIISEYLRFKAYFDHAAPRSPTPGPITKRLPLGTHGTTISLDLGQVGELTGTEEEFMMIEENEDKPKPVDLSTFKDKLKKKIGDTMSVTSGSGKHRK
jgi:coiled-coil domain-containing protein 63/114